MGMVHSVHGPVFGLEERRESFYISFGGDREDHGLFIYADDGVSGALELDYERLSELRDLLFHPAITKALSAHHELPARYAHDPEDVFFVDMARGVADLGTELLTDEVVDLLNAGEALRLKLADTMDELDTVREQRDALRHRIGVILEAAKDAMALTDRPSGPEG